MKGEPVLMVFENCRLVRGLSRSAICDVQRKTYCLIPNEIHDLLTESVGKNISDIKKAFDNEYDEVIDDNLKILEEAEFIFFTNNPNWFPSMDMRWEAPSSITHALIDITPASTFDFKSIWEQLCDLGCEHVQLRSFKPIAFNELKNILKWSLSSRINSIEIILPFIHNLDDQILQEFTKSNARIFAIIFHSSPYDRQYKIGSANMGNIIFSKDVIDSNMHCGQINETFFSLTIESFTEAKNFNSCLNRKISINENGFIKNCPSMLKDYGNISTTTLKEVVSNEDFTRLWHLKKDEIEKCQHCEFRYICTDCRAYLENPENIYSKPLKCGYDPQTCVWENWSNNPLKQHAIKYYGFQ